MIRSIANLIADRTGFVKGTTLQVGHRVQDAPDRCLLVAEPAGGETNFDCPEMNDINIQVVSRAPTYFQSRDDCWTVYRALHGTSGWNMPAVGSGPDFLAMTVEAISIPQYIGPDGNGCHEFSVNFIFRVEEGSCAE